MESVKQNPIRRGLTSYQLKWIAVITMVIDHTGAVLYPGELIFRYIGRIAFPIFCFLLVEGFLHTRDIRQYMLRLGLFAIVSEIPFDLAFNGQMLEFTHQNVYFTLFFGVLMMYVLSMGGTWPEKAVEILLIMWLTVFLKTDYSFKGILLILIYYKARAGYDYLYERYNINHILGLSGGILWNFLWNWRIQRYGVAATIPIALYNGERGRKMKYFFYIFYPAHLLILYLIHRYTGILSL